MKTSIRNKLETLSDRLEEINALLADPEIINDQNRFRALSQEYAQINPVVDCFHNHQSTLDNIEETQNMLKDSDADMREMAEEELKAAEKQKEESERVADNRFIYIIYIYLKF